MVKAIAAERKKEEDERKKQQHDERIKKAKAIQPPSLAESSIIGDVAVGEPAIRMTRRQKRKSVGEAASNTTSTMNPTNSSSSTVALTITGRRILAAPGADVMATIPAEELDEHAGLDESALREHEEVAKAIRSFAYRLS
jgi:hypothetical protein